MSTVVDIFEWRMVFDAMVDWDLTDPAGRTAAQVRPIRDEIDRRVRALIAELTAEAGRP